MRRKPQRDVGLRETRSAGASGARQDTHRSMRARISARSAQPQMGTGAHVRLHAHLCVCVCVRAPQRLRTCASPRARICACPRVPICASTHARVCASACYCRSVCWGAPALSCSQVPADAETSSKLKTARLYMGAFSCLALARHKENAPIVRRFFSSALRACAGSKL